MGCFPHSQKRVTPFRLTPLLIDAVVIGLAVGYGLSNFEQFVGSLRATGYNGHIIIGIGENPPSGVVEYLTKRQVTIKVVKFTQCTFTNYTTNTGQLSPFNQRQKCAVGYPDYKIQWGRFPLAADWLRECTGCTGGVMLTDVRDVFFQRDPFAAVVTPHPIMVFEEHPMLTTEYWLVGCVWPICVHVAAFRSESLRQRRRDRGSPGDGWCVGTL